MLRSSLTIISQVVPPFSAMGAENAAPIAGNGAVIARPEGPIAAIVKRAEPIAVIAMPDGLRAPKTATIVDAPMY
ncbi:MAG: hypothetical protein Pars92KO_30390 [Parasphingorhabdus sp.]